jgi:hypothetical protein
VLYWPGVPSTVPKMPQASACAFITNWDFCWMAVSTGGNEPPALAKPSATADLATFDARCKILDDWESRMRSSLSKFGAVVLLSLAVPAAAHAEPCRTQAFRGASYLVCSFDLTKANLRTYWRGDDGKPHRTFAALAEGLERTGRSLRFAMNGGMYGSDFRPVGLYIENGRELAPANTTTLTGAPSQIPNFYKKPNGVFYLGNNETARFALVSSGKRTMFTSVALTSR